MPKVTYDVRTAVKGEKDGAKRVSGRSKEGVKTFPARRRRTGQRWQRPLPIMAAGGEIDGSVRCQPDFILMEYYGEQYSAACVLHNSDADGDFRRHRGCQDRLSRTCVSNRYIS